jgi:hypothetical protein
MPLRIMAGPLLPLLAETESYQEGEVILGSMLERSFCSHHSFFIFSLLAVPQKHN